jgi:hypothetical protein
VTNKYKARRPASKRATGKVRSTFDARHLGEIVGAVLRGDGYTPTLAGPDCTELAEAFDACMVALKRPERAWRGSAPALYGKARGRP